MPPVEAECVGSPTDAGGGAAEGIRERIGTIGRHRVWRGEARPRTFANSEHLQMLLSKRSQISATATERMVLERYKMRELTP